MIGQLQNSFGKGIKSLAVSTAMLSMPIFAHAENVSAEFVATDWLIFVKSENSTLTELSRHTHGPAIFTDVTTSLNLNMSANGFEQNYLYILAGNPHDGLMPYLAGRLIGHKTVKTGDRSLTVMESGFRGFSGSDRTLPPDMVVIEEIISGGFGGGPFTATQTTPSSAPPGHVSKPANDDKLAWVWGKTQNEAGDANVFRIPYSALFNFPENGGSSGPAIGEDSSTSSSGGVTVNVDVSGLLNSIFSKKDKKKDTPKEDIAPKNNLDPVIPDEVTTTTSQITSDPETIIDTEPTVITLPPEIVTQYVSDPDILAERDNLLEERENMLEYISGLTNIIKEREHEMRTLNARLAFAENGKDSVAEVFGPMQNLIDTQKERLETQSETLNQNLTEIEGLKETIATQKNTVEAQANTLSDNVTQISALNTQIKKLKQQLGFMSPPFLISGGLGLLGLGGLAGLMLGRKRHNKTCDLHLPPAKKEEDDDNPKEGSSFESLKKGMAFSASPMLLGGLPPALAAIKPVYDAVGRIGFAQNGKPVGQDESFGTGILVSERHILTNRHVLEMFRHRLLSDEPTGIEFYGEKESDKSDFVTFADIEPVCIDGWDAAIFTLSRTPENRNPVTIAPRPSESLNDLDIVVVGYPQAQRLTEDIAEVTEKDPIFGVKRYSEGKIFRHSADIENPYGVEAAVESIINPSESMRAICHNASTLGGSSGSAVVCKKTGELIALHFGFDSAYEWEEAANFAVAGENLADKVAKITNSVTPITEQETQ